MNYYWKEKCKELYDINIYEKNKQIIISGGIGDNFLKNAKKDNRLPLALLIRISPETSTKTEKRISELKQTRTKFILLS